MFNKHAGKQWVKINPYFLKNSFSIAAACYTLHYAKRLLETIFVHRFSHSTMPIMNLFKNCSYYWGFTAYVAYHVNHPLFTAPSSLQVYGGLATFIVNFGFFCCYFISLIFVVVCIALWIGQFFGAHGIAQSSSARHKSTTNSSCRRKSID